MAGEEFKISNSATTTDVSQLSDEEKKKIEQERIANETAARNKVLSDAISGGKNEVDLEAQYAQIKAKKAVVKAEFNQLHSQVQDKHAEYTSALQTRAKAGWKKLGLFDVYSNSKKMLNTFQTAYTNLTTYGDLKGVNIGTTGINDPKRLTSYVSNQEFSYNKENKTHLTNYEAAQQEFAVANNHTNQVDRELTAGIDGERGLVDDMRFLDKQLQNNIIAQNYLA